MLRLRGKKRSQTKDSETPSSKQGFAKRDRRASKPLGDIEDKDEAEKVLEKLVFGGEDEILEKFEHRLSETKDQKILSFTDTEKKPVWEDEDESEILQVDVKQDNLLSSTIRIQEKTLSGKKYSQHLKQQFERIHETPEWAKLTKHKKSKASDDESDSEDILQSTGNYLTSSETLPKSLINIKKCSDANKESPTQGKLKSVQFHPTAQVLLTAGMDQRLNLFQVDGKQNPKIQSVFVEKFPIFTARFSASGEEVIMASRHKNFYYYDMIAGKIINIPHIKGLEENSLQRFVISPDGRFIAFLGNYGNIHLISGRSKEWISSLKMNGSVESAAFSHDGTQLYSFGDDSEVYVWDMSTRDCIHRFTDDGFKGTSITASRNGQYIACGSYSGVVNIYNSSCLSTKSPKPLKSLMNLVTPCTAMVFNSNAEMLAISSDFSERAVKLVHFPSMTVFSNFPEKTDNIRIPLCVDFSINSGYFSIANHKGQALLYRLKHYENY